MIRRLFFFVLAIGSLLTACSDDDTFSTDRSNVLSFSVDTVMIDTLFSTVPSSTYGFWVRNNSSDGIRIQNVRLERGSQSGFRVNVDGTFLDPVAYNLEVRKGDSLAVFVEVTTSETGKLEPQLIEDNLLFTLESGVVQKMNLRTWSWDAEKISLLRINADTTIESSRPIIVYDSIVVDSGAVLRLQNTQMFFHDGAQMIVRGSLQADSCLFRGDRLDYMFDYLPYDRISGQWKGIHLYASSKGNLLIDTEIRNPEYGIICDSASIDDAYRLRMLRCIVHNCKGAGVELNQTYALLENCQLTNTLGDCLKVSGGHAEIQYCTIAQFYPFSANRGAALYLTNQYAPLERFICEGSIITGYEDDVVMGSQKGDMAFNYSFNNCLLRTPKVDDAEHYNNIIWESMNDSIQGTKHFVTIDEENLYYDFHLVPESPAVGLGCY